MKRKHVIGFVIGALRFLVVISICYVILRPLLAKDRVVIHDGTGSV